MRARVVAQLFWQNIFIKDLSGEHNFGLHIKKDSRANAESHFKLF